ncbi:hypothetical protein ACWC5I_00425 [Kitasatospora sp. NPDC001574]
MERTVLVGGLLVYAVTSFRYRRTPWDRSDPGKLLFARVSEHRTVEVWRRGLCLDVRVFDRY